MDEAIAEGELVVLLRPGAPRTMLHARRGPQSLAGEGVVDLTAFIGRPPGGSFEWAGQRYHEVRPSLGDRLSAVRRRAQVVLPKDAAALVTMAGIGPGSRVAEAGSGTGMLTLVLAHFVGPSGRVHSFDRRGDFLDVARENLANAGWAERVVFAERDVASAGFGLERLDAVLLDLPEPWTVVPAARSALRIGGWLGTYTPTYNQLERTVRAMREAPLGEVRSVELLERSIHVGEGGTRPEFEMLGHSGFLSVGRRET